MDDVINEYFKTINPLATKISVECDDVKRRYGNKWMQLSLIEQEAILDKYFFQDKAVELLNLQEILKIESGVKVVVNFNQDEMGWTWTDEHSGPFSWKTKSQQDLSLASLNQVSEEESRRRSMSRKEKKNIQIVNSTEGVQGIENKLHDDDEVFLKGLQTDLADSCAVDSEDCAKDADCKKGVQTIIKNYEEPASPHSNLQNKISNSKIVPRKLPLKKVTTLRVLKNVQEVTEALPHDEPTSPTVTGVVTKQPQTKTGFDFLDNW